MREDLRQQFSSDGDEQPAGHLPAHGHRRDARQRAGAVPAAQGDGREARHAARGRPAPAGREGQARGASPPRPSAAPPRAAATRRRWPRPSMRSPCRSATSATAVGDVKESTGKAGDVVVAIGACHGPSQGRIVFEAKNSRLSRPEAVRQLDERAARAQRRLRGARRALRGEGPGADARAARVQRRQADRGLRRRRGPAGAPGRLRAGARPRAHGAAAAPRASTASRSPTRSSAPLGALEEVRRIRQQLTGAKTQIDRASEIVGAMSDRVGGHLEEIAALVRAAEDVGEET